MTKCKFMLAALAGRPGSGLARPHLFHPQQPQLWLDQDHIFLQAPFQEQPPPVEEGHAKSTEIQIPRDREAQARTWQPLVLLAVWPGTNLSAFRNYELLLFCNKDRRDEEHEEEKDKIS